MLVLEIGGKKQGCKPTIVPDATVVDCTRLPNPHMLIRKGKLTETYPVLLLWMKRGKFPESSGVMRKAKEVVKLIRKGGNVRVECLGGKHRSQVVAKTALELLTPEERREVQPVYRDADPLPTE